MLWSIVSKRVYIWPRLFGGAFLFKAWARCFFVNPLLKQLSLKDREGIIYCECEEGAGGDCLAYVALYRKWRPDCFANLVGQEHVSRTLSNAIKTGRIGHAYLFSGPRGTGKTSTAKILAKALNCQNGPTTEPCNCCPACERINNGSSMDVFEIDAASNRGIDEIRELRETVKFAPVDGRYKVYIIDEVHMLTNEAFNALLKTLEEPPGYVVFIMATTEAHKVPATIQSRCQRYDFKRITVDDILGRLQLIADEMELTADREALRMIALKADGGMRDALSLLDQCLSLSEGGLTVERVQQLLGLVGQQWLAGLVNAIKEADSASVLNMVDDLIQSGKDLQQVLGELGMYFRSIMIFKAAGSMAGKEFYQQDGELLKSQAAGFTQQQTVWIIRRIHEAIAELKWSPQPRIAVEAALLEICQYDVAASLNGLNSSVQEKQAPSDGRIAQLESKLAQMMAMLRSQSTARPSAEVPKPKTSGAVRQKVAVPMNQAAVAPTEEGLAAWERMLEMLRQDGKAPQVVACLANCSFLGMDEAQFVIGASSVFKGIIERTYTNILTRYIAQATGKELRLVCREAAPVPQAPPEPPKGMMEDVPPPTDDDFDLDGLPEEERNRLNNAIDVFGDNLVHMDDLPAE